jgi:hypothetical protein
MESSVELYMNKLTLVNCYVDDALVIWSHLSEW